MMETPVRATGARYAIEVGTFTGYSALAIARGLPVDGRLLCCDTNPEWGEIAREYWRRTRVHDRIELRIGPAIETLRSLPATEQFDFAFIDADKPAYYAYYEELLPRMRQGALLLADGFGVASNLMWAQDRKLDPPGDARVVPPFAAMDGGKPTYWTTPGILGYSVIKQASPERIKEILRVLNWLAAPLGSHEYLLKTYGLEGEHWKPDANGNPILTDRGKADATVPFHYVTRAPTTMYWPDTPNKTPGMHDVQNAYHPYISLDPTAAFYSETYASKYPALNNDLVQVLNDVVVGRQPLSAFDQAVKDWQDHGGNQIRREFEQAIAAARG